MSARKSALFIAYHYPPRGGVAVLRTVKFLKYLHRLDWRLKVLTLKTTRYPVTDDTMGREVPEDVEILRLPDPGPFIGRVARKLTMRRFSASGFPDVESWWVPMAAAAAIRTVVRHRIPVIYTTSPPHSTQLVGEWCKRATGARWVADFRDTWGANPYFVEPAGWRRSAKEGLERRVLEQADVVLANTPHARDQLAARYPRLADKFVWLPNGYDPEDFVDGVDTRPEPRPLRFMYVGSMGHTRPFDYFLQALEGLVKAGVPGADRIEVVLVGPVSKRTENLAQELGIAGQVRSAGQLPHGEAVARMHSCDVLLLLQFADHGGATALPSKVFEYMRAKKVIFGMACEGPTKDLIRDYPAGFVTGPDDVGAIEGVLRELIDRHRQGTLPVVEDDEQVERFSRARLAQRLDDIMTGLLTAGPQSEHARPSDVGGEGRLQT